MKRILLLFLATFLIFNNISSETSDSRIILENQQSGKIKEVERHIKNFYVAYCTWIDKGIDKTTGDKLVTQYLTNKLIDKKKRVAQTNGYDLVIYAQDFDQTGVKSLAVKHIEGDWYAVSYYNSYDQHCVIIPLKISILNDIIKIDDIVELE